MVLSLEQRARLLPIFLAATLSTTAGAGWAQDPAGGQPPPLSEDHRGDFSVLQIATTNPDKLNADWQQPTAGANLSVESQMKRNEPIVTFLIFKGCAVDNAGNCNVTAQVEAIAPDGKRSRAPLLAAAARWRFQSLGSP